MKTRCPWTWPLVFCLFGMAFAACDDPVSTCGNGTLEAGEECEPGLLAAGCVEAGYWGGSPGCTSRCKLDLSSCEQVIDLQQSTLNTCVLTTYGSMYCWGDGRSGTHGGGTFENQSSAVKVQLGRLRVRQFSLAGSSACALDEDGWIACWGDNYYGQFGNGTDDNQFAIPQGVYRNMNGFFVEVVSTGTGTLAIDDQGQLWQWGKLGETASGDSVISNVPVVAPRVSHLRFERIFGLKDAYCGLDRGNQLWCWGSNEANRLCRFDGAVDLAPFVLAPSPGRRFVEVHMKVAVSCFLDDAGEGFCCGRESDFGAERMALSFPGISGMASLGPGYDAMGIVLDTSRKATVWKARRGEFLLEYEDMVPSDVPVTGVSWGYLGGCIQDEKGHP